jgi:peptidoglycan L-alanyl-D-glutamate endopeptidase CwlK
LEKQALLVLSGHSRVKFSFHNVVDKAGIPQALAVDVVDSRYAWREPDCMPFFHRMGEIARGLGLYWGGDWKTFKDWAHVQYCDNDKLMSVKEGWMPV